MMKNKKIVLGILVLGFLISGIVAYVYWGKYEQEAETGIEWFQTGNNLHQTELQPKQSRELEENHIGHHWYMRLQETYTEKEINKLVDKISDLGLKWVRLSIDHFDRDKVDWTNGGYSKYYIDPIYDKAVTRLAESEIGMIYSLVFWDPESPGKEKEKGYTRFKTEDEVQRYLDYVQFLVHNFKDRIEYYEILNETHVKVNGGQDFVELADYINLVKRVIPVIREEYPEAKIVVGATPNLYQPSHRDYFFGILDSDIMPLVDAVSFHPMYGTSPEYDFYREYYYSYPSIVQEIKDRASVQGFKGEYIAEEINWRTSRTAFPDEPWTYSEVTSAKYYARGIVMHLGMNITAVLILHQLDVDVPELRVVQNLSTVMAGAKPVSLLIEIESEATNIRHYGFALPNGDKLLALWTDGVAVDDDTGIETTVTIPGLSTKKATGIDIIKGFQQSIITSNENGTLAIQNLLVKDYPLILHISKSSQ